METYSFKATKAQIKDIVKEFKLKDFCPLSDYMAYKIKTNDLNIVIYTSDKVVISGKKGKEFYERFVKEKEVVLPQAGSDEVGTGDFFGPICVCASYVDEKIYAKIADLNLTDSKALSDQYILKIGSKLIETVPHSLLILDNEKYNQINQQNNMNKMKARMHNKAYLNLQAKGVKLPELVVIDDFCGENLYYRYLGSDEPIKGITFKTKAESQYISVAIGSIISRYAFLKLMEEMGKKYNTTFPKGAGEIVDEFAQEFCQKHGKEEFKKVAKCNFKNYQRILELF